MTKQDDTGDIKTDSAVGDRYAHYPSAARQCLEALRAIVVEAASEIEGLSELEETLKWGQPSFERSSGDSPVL